VLFLDVVKGRSRGVILAKKRVGKRMVFRSAIWIGPRRDYGHIFGLLLAQTSFNLSLRRLVMLSDNGL
jgi:hypothetical protein